MTDRKYEDYFGAFSVKDPRYGATGNGVTDDTAAIQAAIDAARAFGLTSLGASTGAIVFFPPGIYITSAALTFGSVGNFSVQLIGAGRENTLIVGNFTGWVIDHPDDGRQTLEVIKSLYIKNNSSNSASGAVRFQSSQRGLIEDCLIQGFCGVDCDFGSFGMRISTSTISCPHSNFPPGSIGICTSQCDIQTVRLEGWNIAILAHNVGPRIGGGSSAEGCNTAIFLGRDKTQTPDNCSAAVIQGFQTERCGTAVNVFAASGTTVQSCVLTGIAGPGFQVSTATWAAGTATITSVADLVDSDVDAPWSSGTRQVQIQGVSNSNYDSASASSFFTVTKTGAKTFTYAVSDPGGSGVGGAWSRKCQYGIRQRGGTSNTYISNTLSVSAEQAGIDLTYDGNTAGTNTVFIDTTAGAGGWIDPPSNQKSAFKFIMCDHDLILTYNELPGEAGSQYMQTAIEGMRYSISDGAKSGGGTAAPGDALQGGGSQHIPVYRTNSAWIYA